MEWPGQLFVQLVCVRGKCCDKIITYVQAKCLLVLGVWRSVAKGLGYLYHFAGKFLTSLVDCICMA